MIILVKFLIVKNPQLKDGYIRHLLIYDKTLFIGLISIKDLIKPLIDKNKYVVTKLSDFNMGKGAFFGSE